MNVHVITALRFLGNLPSDRRLARRLRISDSAMSAVRHERRAIGPSLMIVINEEFDMSIAEQKWLIALPVGAQIAVPAMRMSA